MKALPASGPSRARRFRWLALAACAVVLAVACGANEGDRGSSAAPTPTGTETTAASTLTGNITVLAAASLTEAFTELGTAFESTKPGVEVTFSFGASSTLATQANRGAPADVFASADEVNMARVTEAGNARGPVTFAQNRLAILVAKGNPKGIDGLADLARAGVTVVLCAVEVPCGTFGQQALDKADVAAKPRSYEENVKAVVTKVTLGEADAGIVYVTDAEAAGGKAETVDIPDEHNVIASYPIAVLEQSRARHVASAFSAFVTSAAGQQILVKYGFLPPT